MTNFPSFNDVPQANEVLSFVKINQTIKKNISQKLNIAKNLLLEKWQAASKSKSFSLAEKFPHLFHPSDSRQDFKLSNDFLSHFSVVMIVLVFPFFVPIPIREI